MKSVRIRPRTMLEAFQWDGGEVERFSRVEVGRDTADQPVYNLVAVNIDGNWTFAKPGDWIVTGRHGGSWVWPAHDFDATYEVVDE